MQLIVLLEGLRMFKRRLRYQFFGFKEYKGSVDAILEAIIRDAWNKKKHYFQVSSGHFTEFYTRDFGWVTRALLHLGYEKEVKATLAYALKHFAQDGHIRTSITPWGKPFDFPTYAPDSLAMLLHSLRLLGDKALVEQYKQFLTNEIKYFVKKVVDPQTGLPRKEKHFSSMKDYSKRQASCYDLCMIYLVQKNAQRLGLYNPLRKYNYKQLLMRYYFAHDYFLDDLSGKTHVAGDAQLFPFWTGLIDDKTIFQKVKNKIEEIGLLHPFPMKYTNHHNTEVDFISISLLNPEYEMHAIWAHMGMLWLEVLQKFDKPFLRKTVKQYSELVRIWRTFLEVYDSHGKPLKNVLYVTDEAMLWGAILLDFRKRLKMNHNQ